MNYENYKESRNVTWEILDKLKISSLPIRITSIVKSGGIKCYSYKESIDIITELNLSEHSKKTDGFAIYQNGKHYIFYNQECSQQRCRFTIAHELGHVLLGHVKTNEPTPVNREPSSDDNDIEKQANVFASRILAPACVLWGLNIHRAQVIADICGISLMSAEFRTERMEQLYEREQVFLKDRGKSCFLLSPLERKVFENFKPFIDSIKNRP